MPNSTSACLPPPSIAKMSSCVMRVSLLLVCVVLQPSSALSCRFVTTRPRGVALRLRDSNAVRMMAEPTEDLAVATTGEVLNHALSASCTLRLAPMAPYSRPLQPPSVERPPHPNNLPPCPSKATRAMPPRNQPTARQPTRRGLRCVHACCGPRRDCVP